MLQRNVFAILATFVIAVVLLTSTGDTMAQRVDTALQAHRGHVLAALDSHIQAVGDIVDGKVPYWHHIPDHAVAIVGCSRGLLEIFPEKAGGTSGKNGKNSDRPTSATPFASAAVKFNEQAALMVQMVTRSKRDPIVRQYAALKESYDALRKLTE